MRLSLASVIGRPTAFDNIVLKKLLYIYTNKLYTVSYCILFKLLLIITL